MCETIRRHVDLLEKSWRENWPIFAGAFTLIAVTILGAAAFIPSVAPFVAVNATDAQIQHFGVVVMTGVAATMTLNIGVRLSRLRAALIDAAEKHRRLEQEFSELGHSVKSLMPPPPKYELLADSPLLWSSLKGPYKAVNPSLRTEVVVVPAHDGMVLYHVNPQMLAVWKERVRNNSIDILLTKISRSDTKNVVQIRRDQYDFNAIVRMTVFLNELAHNCREAHQKVSVWFSDKTADDLQSSFAADIANSRETTRRAVLAYCNDSLSEDGGQRQVIVRYEKERLDDWDKRWHRLSNKAHRWSIEQLSARFCEFIPGENGRAVKPPPRKSDSFDPTMKRTSEEILVENCDHFAFRPA